MAGKKISICLPYATRFKVPASSPNASFTCTRAPTARDVYAYFAYFDWRKQSFEKIINLFCAEKQHNFAIAFE